MTWDWCLTDSQEATVLGLYNIHNTANKRTAHIPALTRCIHTDNQKVKMLEMLNSGESKPWINLVWVAWPIPTHHGITTYKGSECHFENLSSLLPNKVKPILGTDCSLYKLTNDTGLIIWSRWMQNNKISILLFLFFLSCFLILHGFSVRKNEVHPMWCDLWKPATCRAG